MSVSAKFPPWKPSMGSRGLRGSVGGAGARTVWVERPENEPVARFQRDRASFSLPLYTLPELFPERASRGQELASSAGPSARKTAQCAVFSEVGKASAVPRLHTSHLCSAGATEREPTRAQRGFPGRSYALRKIVGRCPAVASTFTEHLRFIVRTRRSGWLFRAMSNSVFGLQDTGL